MTQTNTDVNILRQLFSILTSLDIAKTLTYDEFAQQIRDETHSIINREGRDYADNPETIHESYAQYLFVDADSPVDAASFRGMERNDFQRSQLSVTIYTLSFFAFFPCLGTPTFKKRTFQKKAPL